MKKSKGGEDEISEDDLIFFDALLEAPCKMSGGGGADIFIKPMVDNIFKQRIESARNEYFILINNGNYTKEYKKELAKEIFARYGLCIKGLPKEYLSEKIFGAICKTFGKCFL